MRGLLSPYTDAELDLVRELEIERHLQECPDCAAAVEKARSLSRRLGDPALYHEAPAGLHKRIRVSLRGTDGGRGRKVSLPWGWLSVAAATAALVAAVLWDAHQGQAPPVGDELLTRQVVAAHVRSLMLPSHKFDVKSSNQHEVKPWFSDKVDVVPEVKDLAPQDFPLLGGRLEYLDDRPTAALVYGHAKHIINVFVYKTQGKDRPPEVLQRQGYNLIRWTENERMFWVISDLNQKELLQFSELLRH
jgi:anti-sigma factor RsiW